MMLDSIEFTNDLQSFPLFVSKGLIESHGPHLNEAESDAAIRRKIDLEGEYLEKNLRRQQSEDLIEAQQAESRSRSELDRHRQGWDAELKNFRQELARPPGSIFAAAIYASCAAVCVAAEFYLNQQALAFLFDFVEGSVSAVASALSAALSLVLLEVAFDRLIEEPWRRAVLGKGPRRRALVVMGTFMTLLCLGNLAVVSLLGEARGIALQIQAALLQDKPVEISLEPAFLASFTLGLSLLLAVNGAWFLLLSRYEGRRFFRLASQRWRLARVERHIAEAKQRCRDDAKRVNKAKTKMESGEAESVAENYRQARLCQLIFQLRKSHDSRKPAGRSYREWVEEELSKRIEAAPMRVH